MFSTKNPDRSGSLFGKEETQEETRKYNMNVFNQKTQKKKKNSGNDVTARTIGAQSARDYGGWLGEGGCKDGISVESQLGLWSVWKVGSRNL